MEEITAPLFVNACGAWAGHVVDLMRARADKPHAISALPVKARKRSVFMFHRKPSDTGVSASAAAATDGENVCSPRQSPLVVDPNGVYFRSEGKDGNFICGMSPLEPGSALANPENGNYLDGEGRNILTHDPDCDSVECLNTPDHALFDEFIWPTLYQRVPAFGDLKLKSAWAGFYEYNTFDQVGHCMFSNILLDTAANGVTVIQQSTPLECLVDLTHHLTCCLYCIDCFSSERDHRTAPGHPEPAAVQRLLRPRPPAVSRRGSRYRGADHGTPLPDHRPVPLLLRQDPQQQAHLRAGHRLTQNHPHAGGR